MQYWVYRFVDAQDRTIYVGRTSKGVSRFINHEHISDKVAQIYYTVCKTKADMIWKEVYYINHYFNSDYSENLTDVYEGGVTDIHLHDNWRLLPEKAWSCAYSNRSIQESYDLLNIEYAELVESMPKLDYKSLIILVGSDKANYLQDDNALTKNWFYTDKRYGGEKIKKLRGYMSTARANHFKNCKSVNTLWTTYTQYREDLKGKGYTKGFVYLDEPCFDSDKYYLMFVANPHMPTVSKSPEDSDRYALVQLFRFLRKSALMKGQPVYLYLPSYRMRTLLSNWIEARS